MKKAKLKFLLISILLSFLLVFNPLLAPLAWAEESGEAESEVGEIQIEPLPNETQPKEVNQGELPAEETQEDNTESLGEESPESTCDLLENNCGENEIPENDGDATIITGDADSTAEIEIDVNDNETTLPGEVTEDACGVPTVESECFDCAAVESDNTAEIDNLANSNASSGDNSINDASGSASIDTGDSSATANVENAANTNLVILEDGEDSGEEEAFSASFECGALEVDNQNEGDVDNQIGADADTGENTANGNEGEATIETGDAVALVNLLNLLNTNIVGSDFEILIMDLLENHQGEIDLNEIWKEILGKEGSESLFLAGEGEPSNLDLLVTNDNQAGISNQVDVEASTGDNQANQNQSAGIDTGDATAIANVTNFANTNIVGSKFFLGIINILGFFEGNIYLPRPELFTNPDQGDPSSSSLPPSQVYFSNQNQAQIQDQVGVTADTGSNEENNNLGDSQIESGTAKAVANTFSVVNLNIVDNYWFRLIITNLGNWQGKISGWTAPDSEELPEQGVLDFAAQQEGVGFFGEETNVNLEGDIPFLSFENENQVEVENDINVSASTGGNQANENEGDASIKTGRATAIANISNFINVNILGGRWFWGLINLPGNWRGNLVFSYPDVVSQLSNGSGSVSVGETTEYSLSYENQGHDEAKDVWLALTLPKGLVYLGDSSGFPSEVNGQACSWFLGTLQPNESGNFSIQVQVDSDFSFGEDSESLSFWSKIIPQVMAAENGKEKEVTATASIGTIDPESNLANNNSSAVTLIYSQLEEEQTEEKDEVEEEPGVDSRQPILEISAWNNVNEFVYTGDTVLFEVTIYNTSDVPSYDTYLFQELFNGLPKEGFGTVFFEIGTLEPDEGVRVTFGLKLADNGQLPGGSYHTLAQAFGYAPNGNEVASNQAGTEFEFRLKEISSLFEAKALGKEEGEVLGALENECPDDKDILPYVLLFLLSSLGLVERSRRLAKVKQVYDEN